MGHNPFFSVMNHVFPRERARKRERTRSSNFLPRRSISSSMLDEGPSWSVVPSLICSKPLATSPRTNIAPESFCLHGLVPCFLNFAFRACDHTSSGTFTFTCTSNVHVRKRQFYPLDSTKTPSNLRQRLEYHNTGRCPHTSKFTPWRVETYIAFSERSTAVAFEKHLKTGAG